MRNCRSALVWSPPELKSFPSCSAVQAAASEPGTAVSAASRIAAMAPATIAEQLSRVRDAGVRREARLEPRELVEGRERLAVAAELDERVADGAECPRLGGCERSSTAREDERLAEAMARERERGEAGERDGAVVVELERPPEHRFRPRVVRRVAGLTRALLVGEPQQRV